MCLLLGMRRHQGKLEEWWALPEGQWGCGVPTTDSMTPRQWEGGAWHREPPPLCSMPGDARASCLPAGHRVVQERTPASLGPGTHMQCSGGGETLGPYWPGVWAAEGWAQTGQGVGTGSGEKGFSGRRPVSLGVTEEGPEDPRGLEG